MQVLKTIQIDVSKKGIVKTVYAKQFDSRTREIVVRLMDDDEPFNIDTGANAVFTLVKPDGRIVMNEGNISGSEITVELTGQMLAASGVAQAEITVYKDTQLLTSAKFYIEIDSSIPTNVYTSKDDFQIFIDAFNSIGPLNDEAAAAAEAANTAAQDAEKVNISSVQTASGVEITTTDRTGTSTETSVNAPTVQDVLDALPIWSGGEY